MATEQDSRTSDGSIGPPTMADVGRLAGVSAMTVSRALKGNSYIAKDTLERIMAAVDQLGYLLDQSASHYRPSIDNSNFADTA